MLFADARLLSDMLPCVDEWRRIDLRMQTLLIAQQQALTKVRRRETGVCKCSD